MWEKISNFMVNKVIFGLPNWASILIGVVIIAALVVAGIFINKAVVAKKRYENRVKPIENENGSFKRTGQNQFKEEEVTFKKTGGQGDYVQTKEEKWFIEDREEIAKSKAKEANKKEKKAPEKKKVFTK